MQHPDVLFALKPLNGVDMEEISLHDLQRHLSSGTFSSRELTEWSLDRIEQVSFKPLLENWTEQFSSWTI